MSAFLELKGLKKTFFSRQAGSGGEREVRALNNVDLTVFPGEHLSIVGGSGCGKTTLAKAVMGLVKPDAGKVLFGGSELGNDLALWGNFRRKVRMVFQDPFSSLDPRFTVRAILKEALCLEKQIKVSAEEDKMCAVLRAVELPEGILYRYPHEFSGGERQRIAIARALMTDPRLLILDEAVSSIDVIAQKNILDLLNRLQTQMLVTYIFISHNLRVARKISLKIAVMFQGRIVEYGSVADIFDRPEHEYTRQLLRAAREYRSSGRDDLVLSQAASLKDIGQGHLVLAG